MHRRSDTNATQQAALAVVPLHSWYHEGFLPADAVERAIKWEDDLRKKADEERRAKEQEEKISSNKPKSLGGGGGDGNKAVVLERSPTLQLQRRNKSALNLATAAKEKQLPGSSGEEDSEDEDEDEALFGSAKVNNTVADEAKAAEEERSRRREVRNRMTVATMDMACVWPRCFGAVEGDNEGSGVQGIDASAGPAQQAQDQKTAYVPAMRKRLCDFFAQLNEPLIALSQSLPKGHRPKQVVSYSHFLPHPRLHRGPKFLGEIEGSSVLGEQVRRLKPDTHVFGHTHWDISTSVGGVRYIQKPLGYPKERKAPPIPGEGRRIHISTAAAGHEWAESPPLALVWSDGDFGM